LTAEEVATIDAKVAALEDVMKVENHSDIRAAIEALDKATARYAEISMSAAVTSAIVGETMSSAGDKMGEGPKASHPFAKAEVI
jgi:hypothetical protein